MRIGIDCRMAGTGEGIGRYVEELVKHLTTLDKVNQYFLVGSNQFLNNFELPNNFQFQIIKSDYYTFAEQTKLIWELTRLKLDFMHFPNFNVPILYPGKFVVTIHDLIHHKFPGKKKARAFHRLAYRAVIHSAINKSVKIITVSKATKSDILKTFKIQNSKIDVIYEGVDDTYWSRVPNDDIQMIKAKYEITKPYVLFVGVWRQYKNLERLALAFDILKERGYNLQLVMAGKVDPFYPEIKRAVFSAKNRSDVKALGFVSEEDLPALYQGAKVFALPSLVEGFGLIGLEAQASGIPAAVSAIPVLREILGGAALYFDPNSQNDIAQKIAKILDDPYLEFKLVSLGRKNAEKFDWKKTASQTLEVYKKV